MTTFSAVRYALWALVIAIVVVVTAAALGLWPGAQRGGAGSSEIGAPFTLTAMDGKPYSWQPEDGPTAVFFGFTFCPDVCPTTLYEMSRWLDEVGPDGDGIRALFVTVDPERDTPEKLDSYLSAFGNRIIGLTGTPQEIEAVAKAFRVYSARVDLEGDDYTMDHTASVLLVRKDGSLMGTIAYGEDGDVAVEKLRRLAAG